jgi:hypothetical protein
VAAKSCFYVSCQPTRLSDRPVTNPTRPHVTGSSAFMPEIRLTFRCQAGTVSLSASRKASRCTYCAGYRPPVDRCRVSYDAQVCPGVDLFFFGFLVRRRKATQVDRLTDGSPSGRNQRCRKRNESTFCWRLTRCLPRKLPRHIQTHPHLTN